MNNSAGVEGEFVCRALPLLSVHWTRVMLPGPEIGGCKA